MPRARKPSPSPPGEASQPSPLPYEQAALTLANRMEALSTDFTPAERRQLSSRLRAVASTLAIEDPQRGRGVEISPEERAIFLVGIGSGLSGTDAARLTGRSWRAFYGLRTRDESFREEWDSALDASTATLDERLLAIGMAGPAKDATMAQVRAIEALQRARRRSERKDLLIGATTTLREERADGTVREIVYRGAAPIPP